ncbi:MAG: hypothetical protein FJ295_19045 [Planctomycetes bacterium]|nr:hypothetical protein [Planctomycetota bacterium]
MDDADRCYEAANDWLANAFADPDLAQDTRVSVPIMVDIDRKVTRLWVTIGVRLTRLESQFATPPRIKPKDGDSDWEAVEKYKLQAAQFLIPVDEFVEVEIPGRPRVAQPGRTAAALRSGENERGHPVGASTTLTVQR